MDALVKLRFAIAATRHGGGGVRFASKVRRTGRDSFAELLRGLEPDQVAAIDDDAERLSDQAISAFLLGDPDYPSLLAESRTAPPALFVQGRAELLAPGIGMCGSRHAGDEGLRAARACTETIVAHGLSLVSGYARGVDAIAHTAALRRGGKTIVVLPEGIERFRVRRGEFADVWDPDRAVVVSQFSPNQPWSAGAAMARNAVISGLSRALVVVEAGETGGTLAAGLHALDRGQPVVALRFDNTPVGNQLLIDKGATAVRSRGELSALLTDLPTGGSAQLSLI